MYTTACMYVSQKIFNEHVLCLILTGTLTLLTVLEQIALFYSEIYWELVSISMLVLENNCLSNKSKITKPSWSS